MAAVLASGRSQLFNAAREPEIVDLCNLLVAMGGEDRRDRLEPPHHRRRRGAPRRRLTKSCPTASRPAATPAPRASPAGSIDLIGARPDDMLAITNALAQAGLIDRVSRQGHQGQRRRQAEAAGAVDRAVSRFSDRHAGAVHGHAVPSPKARASSKRRSSRTATCTSPSCAVWAPTSRSTAARPLVHGVDGLTGARSWRPTCAPR